jgi:pyruvate ferredoxin oxidoreductase delta subunit
MARSEIQKHRPFVDVSEYPSGTVTRSGYLVSGSSGWRTEKPVLDNSLCRGCLRCYLLCPDASIDRSGNKVKIDLRFCKGCGICSVECRFGAIAMEKEKK